MPHANCGRSGTAAGPGASAAGRAQIVVGAGFSMNKVAVAASTRAGRLRTCHARASISRAAVWVVASHSGAWNSATGKPTHTYILRPARFPRPSVRHFPSSIIELQPCMMTPILFKTFAVAATLALQWYALLRTLHRLERCIIGIPQQFAWLGAYARYCKTSF